MKLWRSPFEFEQLFTSGACIAKEPEGFRYLLAGPGVFSYIDHVSTYSEVLLDTESSEVIIVYISCGTHGYNL